MTRFTLTKAYVLLTLHQYGLDDFIGCRDYLILDV